MKVGTDGVLLGAWSKTPNGKVLDIGCGSGLISLIIAQRNPNCTIDAIDIDKGAYLQTVNNIEGCRWKTRIKGHHISLQVFETIEKYDLIISNPPFFINAFKSENKSKNMARHTDELSFEDFIANTKKLLTPTGILSVILPINESVIFNDIANKEGLHLNRNCLVKPNYAKDPKRVLMEFSFVNSELQTEHLTIETEKRHQYTKEYRNLTQDFYLKF